MGFWFWCLYLARDKLGESVACFSDCVRFVFDGVVGGRGILFALLNEPSSHAFIFHYPTVPHGFEANRACLCTTIDVL
jgi:hypothetical protein